MYFVEVGLILVVVPWTTYWDRNYFVESLPLLEPILTAHVARGSVTGVGLFSLGAAVVELVALVRRRTAAPLAREPQDDTMLPDTTPRSRIV